MAVMASAAISSARLADDPVILFRALDASTQALQAWCERFDNGAVLDAVLKGLEEARGLVDQRRDFLRWANIQNRLSSLQACRYRRADDKAALAEAVAGYRAIRAATSPLRHPHIWARATLNLAKVLRDVAADANDLNGLRKAVAPCRAALRVDMRLGDESAAADARHTYAVILSKIADIAYDRDLLREVDQLYAANAAVWSRDARPKDWARMTNSRGVAALTIGEKEGDVAELKRALEMFGQLDDIWTRRSDPENFANLVINRSGTRLRLMTVTGNHGHLQAAMSDIHQAIALYRGTSDKPYTASLLHVLGVVEASLGLAQRDERLASLGERHLRAALRIFKQLGTAAAAYVALTLNNLAEALLNNTALGRASERLARAEKHAREAFAISSRAGATDQAIEAERHLFAALLERAARLKKPGRRLLSLAQEIEMSAAQHPRAAPWETAALQVLAANARAGAARLSEGPAEDPRLVPALSELFSFPTLSPTVTIGAGLELGQVLLASGERNAAIETWSVTQDRLWNAMLQADGAAERRALARLASAGMGGRGMRGDVLGSSVALGDDLALALLDRGEPGDDRRALAALARSRCMLRMSMSAPDQMNHLKGAVRAASARRRSAEAYVSAKARVGVREAETAAREIAAAVRNAEKAEREFRDAVAAAGMARVPALDVDALATTLPKSGALVAVAVGDVKSAALIVREAAPAEISLLDLPALSRRRISDLLVGSNSGGFHAGWIETLRRFNESINAGDGAAIGELNDAIHSAADQLWSMVMGPIDKKLKSLGLIPGAEVAISAPGALAALPLHAAGPAATDYVFIENWAVRWLADLNAGVTYPHRPDSEDIPTPRLLAVVDPLEDLLGVGTLDPIEQFFLPDRKTVLRGHAATVAAVLENLPRHDYVSFTCHGSYDPANPEMSGLDLAASELGQDGRPQVDRLTVATLRQLPPSRRRLCILAACETAMFDINDVVNELEGLQTEFIELGFSAVIAASWPVTSYSTDKLIEHFCRFHFAETASAAERTPAAALRFAQLEMRNESAGASDLGELRKVGHQPAEAQADLGLSRIGPFWWAGFRVLGAPWPPRRLPTAAC